MLYELCVRILQPLVTLHATGAIVYAGNVN